MKNQIFKKTACFIAAVSITCTLSAGNMAYAAQQTSSSSQPASLNDIQNPEAPKNTDPAEKNESGISDTSDQTSENEPVFSDVIQNPADEPDSSDDLKNPADEPDSSEDLKNPADESDSSEDLKNPADESDPSDDTTPPKTEPNPLKLTRPVLKAASKPNGMIKLRWNKVKGGAEYILFRSTKKNGDFHKIYTSDAKTTYYMDKNRTAGTVYYYKLTAFSKGRTARVSSKVISGRSLEQAELTAISNLSGSRKLVLHWKSVKGADSYQVMRKNPQTGEYQIIKLVNGTKTSYTDSSRSGGTTYSYKICARDDFGGRGNYSKAMSQMAIDKNKKMIALTYDDGPSPHTPIVLNALEKHGAHATFFIVGNRVNSFSASIRREAALGCEIGNHTYSHSNLFQLSAQQIHSVLSATNQAVKNQSGYDIQIMRPPYGNCSSSNCIAAGMPVIMWSIDTLDWKTRSTSATIQCVQQKAYDGAIVLMHDLHLATANAADAIIKYLKNAGYQLVTVSELAAYRGGLTNGRIYSDFRR